MDTRFAQEQKLTLEVIVRDRDESEKLLGWLYNEHSKMDKLQMGCELTSIGFGHTHSMLQALEQKFQSIFNFGSMENWLKQEDFNAEDFR